MGMNVSAHMVKAGSDRTILHEEQGTLLLPVASI